MSDEEWQQRVIEEKKDIAIKLDKLKTFARSTAYAELDIPNKNLLNMQTSVMAEYVDILEQRIDLF